MPKEFSKLLESCKIGKLELKNRIVMAPMGTGGLNTPEGAFSKRGVDYFIERARGGVGLIITGLFKVENEIEPLHDTSVLTTAVLNSFGELAEAVHAYGAKIFVQLTAGWGRSARRARLTVPGIKTVAPSAVPNYWDPTDTCRELTTEEVERFVKKFGVAAQICARAGIDGVEIHAVHEGYLLDQFTIAFFNKRTDKYGGDLRGRLTFPIEVVREIKKCVGADFPVSLRYSIKSYVKDWSKGGLPGEEFEEKGRDTEEGLEAAKILEAAGYDAFNADAGTYDSWYWPHPPMYHKHGLYLPLNEQLKKVVNVPVITAGRMGIPDLAEKSIAEGKTDMVALGRGLLADPYWPKKVEEGRTEHIRPCTACHDGCIGRLMLAKPLSCALNPATGREAAYKLTPTDEPKKVLIAGGGVAGLEAARVAATRKHNVTLYEKSDALGGHLIEASVPDFKKDYEMLVNWYKVELADLGVNINLGSEVNLSLIKAEDPDITIIATGSEHIIPDVSGIDNKKVATATEVLLGKKKAGEEVIVIGGGLIGCETALWLAQQGKKVTIVEMLGELLIEGLTVPYPNKIMLLDLLKLNKVEALTSHSALEVTGDGLKVISNKFRSKTIPADTVVISVGLNPNKKLYTSLVSEIPNLYNIGDSREARNVMGAVWDAYEIARAI